MIVGFGAGELAAAHAAGVFSLEEGLRLAFARDAMARMGPGTAKPDFKSVLADIEFQPPSIALVSGVTGRMAGPEEVCEAAFGFGRDPAPEAHERRCIGTVAERGVEVVVEIGPHGSAGPMVSSAWPKSAAGNGIRVPIVLPGPADGDDSAVNGDTGFVRAVAGAYEAGLPVVFSGLHTGETRHRISVPGYPFEPRRYWIETPKP